MKKDNEEWLKNVEKMRIGSDLSRDEDLSIGLMNLISLEEHFYFSAMKTDDKRYLEMLQAVRSIRTRMLAKIVKDPKGEEWCISKHLLAASMRLMEVGTKELAKGNKKEADECFEASFDLYSLFFAINNEMIGKAELAEMAEPKAEVPAAEQSTKRFSRLVKKVVDCCKEW